MIGGIDRNKKLELILEALEVFPDEQEEYWEFHDEKGESKFTRRGTAIHYLGSGWIDGLVHAETLAKGGFEPRPSTAYTETPFFERFVFPSSEGPIPFTSSMHPDLYYFRKRGDNEFDMVIMDTKSNRVTEYPEHKYLLQTLYYGIFISSIMEKNLGSKIHNIYVVFNKNAFHLGFGGRIDNVIPHHYFRAQKRSRTTKFGPDHPIRLLVPHLVGEIMLEKQLMKEEKGYFFHSRREQNKKHRCKKCFQEQRLLCRYLSREFLLGEDVREYFGKIS